jgi:hypothetical protein
MHPQHFLLIVIIPALLVSCSFGGRSRITATPDGTTQRDTSIYAQLGGKGGFIANGDTGFTMQVDNEKSFGQAVSAAGAAYAVGQWAGVETAKATTAATTAQTGIKATAATDQQRIKATQQAATTLGGNPEANTGAINAVGGLFR